MGGNSATAGLLERSRPAEAWVLGAILVDPQQPPERGIMAKVGLWKRAARKLLHIDVEMPVELVLACVQDRFRVLGEDAHRAAAHGGLTEEWQARRDAGH